MEPENCIADALDAMQWATGFLGFAVFIVFALWDLIIVVSYPAGQTYKSFKQINKLEIDKTVVNVRIIKT